MKLLFLMEYLYPVMGGAERSVASLIEELRKKPGVEIDYICKGNIREPHVDPMSAIERCDVIVTQLRWAREAIKAASLARKKSVMFVRSYEAICQVAEQSEIISHCGQRCHLCKYRWELAERPNLVVANSRFTQRFLLEEHAVDSVVVYPFVDAAKVRAPDRRPRFITMNQLAYHKGADIFLAIAERMPDLEFRVVGYDSWAPSKPFPPNVSKTGVVDAKEFWRDTLVFVAPARWKEAFGRTIVEANVNNVPAIASARGAPKEDQLLPMDQLVEDHENVNAWVDRIRYVLRNYDACVQRTRRFDLAPYALEENVDRFYRLLSRLAGDRAMPSHVGAARDTYG